MYGAFKIFSYINIYALECLKPFTIRPKAVNVKTAKPMFKSAIYVPFQHAFGLKTGKLNVIKQSNRIASANNSRFTERIYAVFFNEK